MYSGTTLRGSKRHRTDFEHSPFVGGCRPSFRCRTLAVHNALDVIAQRNPIGLRILAELSPTKRSEQRLGLFSGLVAEEAGLVDLGGQFLNPCHHTPLLHQRRQRDFARQKFVFLQPHAICRAFARSVAFFNERRRAAHVTEIIRQQMILDDVEHWEVVRDNSFIEFGGHDAKSTVARINSRQEN